MLMLDLASRGAMALLLCAACSGPQEPAVVEDEDAGVVDMAFEPRPDMVVPPMGDGGSHEEPDDAGICPPPQVDCVGPAGLDFVVETQVVNAGQSGRIEARCPAGEALGIACGGVTHQYPNVATVPIFDRAGLRVGVSCEYDATNGLSGSVVAFAGCERGPQAVAEGAELSERLWPIVVAQLGTGDPVDGLPGFVAEEVTLTSSCPIGYERKALLLDPGNPFRCPRPEGGCVSIQHVETSTVPRGVIVKFYTSTSGDPYSPKVILMCERTWACEVSLR